MLGNIFVTSRKTFKKLPNGNFNEKVGFMFGFVPYLYLNNIKSL